MAADQHEGLIRAHIDEGLQRAPCGRPGSEEPAHNLARITQPLNRNPQGQ